MVTISLEASLPALLLISLIKPDKKILAQQGHKKVAAIEELVMKLN
jgi:hypothetical protein